MKLTNILGLPESIVRAVANDPYDSGDSNISVTGLIAPARQRALKIKHADELEEDVADRVWSLYGQIVHGILERADMGEDEIITERRLFIERYNWRISGQFDRLILRGGNTMQDYKFTSLWSVRDGVKPEHEAQQNIYRLMLKEHGHDVEKLQIVSILRDWSKTRAKRDANIPQKPVVVQDVDIWSDGKTEQYIKDRLIAHGNAQTELPECSAEERWERDSVYKVKKNNNKTAVRGHANYQTEEMAHAAAAKLSEDGHTYKVEFHQGEAIRCESYCEVAQHCVQWRSLNTNKLGL